MDTTTPSDTDTALTNFMRRYGFEDFALRDGRLCFCYEGDWMTSADLAGTSIQRDWDKLQEKLLQA